MSMLQLDPPLPMMTPKGEGFAHILLDYGPESDLYWTVLITSTGEIWTYPNYQVRAAKNITLGRAHPSLPDTTQATSPSSCVEEERPSTSPPPFRSIEKQRIVT